jgi:esterase/lipase
MNPTLTEQSAAREMVKTVEDPNRYINREIAHWIKSRDLYVRGVNVAERLKRIENPLLCVLALGDGIVPRKTAAYAYEAVGSTSKKLLEVGTASLAMAHADLFVSNEAHKRVFEPLAAWLADPTGARGAEVVP